MTDTDLCSEVENMNIDYFSFIKDIYNDFLKYIKQYKSIEQDYTKKLNQLQEKYSSQLCDLNKNKKKYKNINTKFIFLLTSTIPKIMTQLVDNLQYFIDGTENLITSLDEIIKEKTTSALKCQDSYDESRINLLKNYKNIDKLKVLYMNSMSNSEDLIYKYYDNKNILQNLLEEKNKKEEKEKNQEKKEKKEKKEKIKNKSELILSLKDQMKNSISNSKKLEKQYKNSFSSIETLEKNFNEIGEQSTENMKKLSYEMTIKLKDIILDFIVLLKNSLKMPLSEIDIILPDISDISDNSKYEKIINDSFDINKKLFSAKPKKYKLKCFSQPLTIEDKYNPNNHIAIIEDGFEELSFVDDLATFFTIKKIYENFDLLENEEFDLKLEKEKIKTKHLTSKLLSFIKYPIIENNILISEKEAEELNKLLDKHYNRVLFLQSLSTFRSNGIYSIPKDIFELLFKYFCTIINTIDRDKDYHSAKNIIILSQTYYILDGGKKTYLQHLIKNEKIFRNFNFWKDSLEYCIEKEIVRSIKSDTKNGTLIKGTQKESDDLYANIVFGQLVPFVDNMIEFGLDRKKIKEIIKPIIKHYNMNEQSINIIDDVIHKNSERKSILLKEEIKQIGNNIIVNKNNENINNKILEEKKEVPNNINELNENKIIGDDININISNDIEEKISNIINDNNESNLEKNEQLEVNKYIYDNNNNKINNEK